jgi:hypothetical protein
MKLEPCPDFPYSIRSQLMSPPTIPWLRLKFQTLLPMRTQYPSVDGIAVAVGVLKLGRNDALIAILPIAVEIEADGFARKSTI